jgi:voltage-gated potassium channel
MVVARYASIRQNQPRFSHLKNFSVIQIFRRFQDHHSQELQRGSHLFRLLAYQLIRVFGTLLFYIENGESPESTSGYDSIHESSYWAAITMTTVGYGDLVPITLAGL